MTLRSARIPIQRVRGCLVASLQGALYRDTLAAFREALLGALQGSAIQGVVVDVSGLPVIDAEEFENLRQILSMADLMGARHVVAGLQPGVVSALLDLDVGVAWVNAARDVDAAIDLLDALPSEVDDAATAPDAVAQEETRVVATNPVAY